MSSFVSFKGLLISATDELTSKVDKLTHDLQREVKDAEKLIDSHSEEMNEQGFVRVGEKKAAECKEHDAGYVIEEPKCYKAKEMATVFNNINLAFTRFEVSRRVQDDMSCYKEIYDTTKKVPVQIFIYSVIEKIEHPPQPSTFSAPALDEAAVHNPVGMCVCVRERL